MTDDEIYEQIGQECGEFVFYLQENFGKKYPKQVVSALATSLAHYISIVSKNPEAALKSVAERLIATDHAELRRAHFSYTLGAHDTQKPKLALVMPPTVLE